jgi:hypothetical protein
MQKNTDSWCARKGDLQHAFPQAVLMVPPKLLFIANSNNPIGVGLAPGSTIHFGSQEFITNHFGHLSLSPQGRDSDAIFIGIIYGGSPSPHTSPKDTSGVDGATSGTKRSSGSPSPRGCYMVTSMDPIIDTGPREHSGPLDHPDGHDTDGSAFAWNGAPSGSATCASLCSTDRRRAMGDSMPRRASQ